MAEAKVITISENSQIEEGYEAMFKTIRSKMDKDDPVNIRKAFELANDAHSHQRRKSGEPYIFHPMAVAQICSEEIGLGPTAIISALLHDVVEDTDITLEQVTQQFGVRISKIVDGLTKLDSAYNAQSPQAANFKKVLSTLVEDVRVVLIKMADRLHNMRTLGSMPRHKQLKIAAETSYMYAPLAHRLGLYNIKTEYLDLCMKITDAGNYHGIAKKLQETKKDRNEFIASFINPLKERLNKELNCSYRISGRPKSIFSIYNKIRTKKVSFEEIYDLFAIRIIVDVKPKDEKLVCWKIYSIVTDVHIPIPERLKDWISTPKSNGYESLHTTVIGPEGRFVEVQIRSERMDEIAECGFAAHWKYKGVSNQPDVYERWLDSVRDILENPEAEDVEFLGDFKANNLFHDEVYVYTPNGDMKILPKGATALDFAFSIHSELGSHCTALKVNNKLVPMGYKLKNGDQVHVNTHPAQKPSEDWLKMVITGKARSKIRSAMKAERRDKGQFGKEALQRKLKNLKVDFEDSVEKITKFFRFPSRIDLFYEIAMHKLTMAEIFKHFEVEGGKLAEVVREEPSPPTTKVEVKRERKKVVPQAKILINGEPGERYNYILANCCNPVQGDPIFAYLTAQAGLKIHRATCPNATNLMANYGYRIMKAEWTSTTNSIFVADLKISGIDAGPGVIEKLTSKISTTLGINIRSFSIKGDQGYFEGKISLMVRNIDELNVIIRTLRSLDYVSTVSRIE